MIKFFSYISEKKVLLLSLISMSLPAILEMALNTMLGVSDTIMISRFIGKEALSSVGFANQIVFTLIFIFSTFNTGAIALISRALGEKNLEKLKNVANQNITINFFIGIMIMLVAFIFNKSIFRIFDISEAVFRDSVKYYNIILIGFVPMFITFAFAATKRGAGDTFTPMLITGIANVINIIGNYLLIKGIGVFPELGIEGAAWSTTFSRFIALFIYIYFIYFKNSEFKLHFKFIFNKDIVKPLWNISLPGGIEQALMQICFVVMSVIVSQLDTVAEATFRILIQIESISFMPAIGLSIATATLVGKSLGEKDSSKAMEVGFLAVAIGILWALFIGLIFVLLSNPILSIFTKEEEVILTGLPVMLFLGINQLGLNFVIILSGALRGAGDTKFVMINTLLRLWIIFIPGSYIFISKLNWGIGGVWYAEILSFIIFAYMLLRRFLNKKWIKEIIF